MHPITKIIWTAGFLIGTTNHALDIYHHGWLPYDWRPLPWIIYWTSLTFFDPLAAILIWIRERWGIVLGVLTMVSNLLVNGYTASLGYGGFPTALILQSAFAAFVFFVAWEHWKRPESQSSQT